MQILILIVSLIFPKQIDRIATIGHISRDQASEHVAAAFYASFEYRVPMPKLLAIAWHESNYKHTERTHEPGRRVSCGAMTPNPKTKCSADDMTILGGYRAGAKHYRVWLDIWNKYFWTDIAYAGGGVSVRKCAKGEKVISPSGHDVCKYPYDLQARANRLMRE